MEIDSGQLFAIIGEYEVQRRVTDVQHARAMGAMQEAINEGMGESPIPEPVAVGEVKEAADPWK